MSDIFSVSKNGQECFSVNEESGYFSGEITAKELWLRVSGTTGYPVSQFINTVETMGKPLSVLMRPGLVFSSDQSITVSPVPFQLQTGANPLSTYAYDVKLGFSPSDILEDIESFRTWLLEHDRSIETIGNSIENNINEITSSDGSISVARNGKTCDIKGPAVVSDVNGVNALFAGWDLQHWDDLLTEDLDIYKDERVPTVGVTAYMVVSMLCDVFYDIETTIRNLEERLQALESK